MKTLVRAITTICAMTLVIGCNSSKSTSSERKNENPFAVQLGKRITLIGIAENLKEGARLGGFERQIFIDDMESWPDELYGKKVTVTGTLIERHDLPVYIPEHENDYRCARPYPIGTDLHEAAQRYLLKDAKWMIVKE